MRLLTITRDLQLALNQYTAGITRSRRAYAEDLGAEKPVKVGRRGPCGCCKEDRVIYSRGLCATCYRRHARAGTLDANHPRSDAQ